MSAAGTRVRSLARPRKGQALIETALVIPLLLALMFGIAEGGLYMYDYVQAINCAREGARRAAVRAADAATPPYCVSADLLPTLTAEGGDYMTAPAGTNVTAVVASDHDWIIVHQLFPLLGGSPLPDSWPISATVVMRLEGVQVPT
jgi:Flp pilus assembly protein TadG